LGLDLSQDYRRFPKIAEVLPDALKTGTPEKPVKQAA
jgi:hypothetical protein